MEIAIATTYEVGNFWSEQEARAWCEAGIWKRIEHDSLVGGVDYDWAELRRVERGDGVMELRLPLKNRIW